MTGKVCSTCKVEKPLTEFHRETRNKIDGHQRICRACTLAHNKAWDDKNPGHRKILRKQWYVKNRDRIVAYQKANRALIQEKDHDRILALRQVNPKLMWAKNALSSARHRARKLNLPCDLTAEFIRSIASDRCPALGIELCYPVGRPGTTKRSHASATIDRLIPSLGYVQGNVAGISSKANLIKNDGTAAEIALVAVWLGAALRPRKIA